MKFYFLQKQSKTGDWKTVKTDGYPIYGTQKKEVLSEASYYTEKGKFRVAAVDVEPPTGDTPSATYIKQPKTLPDLT